MSATYVIYDGRATPEDSGDAAVLCAFDARSDVDADRAARQDYAGFEWFLFRLGADDVEQYVSASYHKPELGS